MNDGPIPGGPPAARRRFGTVSGGWRILLILSLALNFVVVGMVAGSFIAGGPHERRTGGGQGREPAFGPYTGALSPEDRRAVAQRFRERIAAEPGLPGTGASNRQDMARALRAEPFDPAVAARILDGQRQAFDTRFRFGQELLAERIAAMTPAERRAMADRLEDSGSNRR